MSYGNTDNSAKYQRDAGQDQNGADWLVEDDVWQDADFAMYVERDMAFDLSTGEESDEVMDEDVDYDALDV